MANMIQGHNTEDENTAACAQCSKSAATPEPGQCGQVGRALAGKQQALL